MASPRPERVRESRLHRRQLRSRCGRSWRATSGHQPAGSKIRHAPSRFRAPLAAPQHQGCSGNMNGWRRQGRGNRPALETGGCMEMASRFQENGDWRQALYGQGHSHPLQLGTEPSLFSQIERNRKGNPRAEAKTGGPAANLASFTLEGCAAAMTDAGTWDSAASSPAFDVKPAGWIYASRWLKPSIPTPEPLGWLPTRDSARKPNGRQEHLATGYLYNAFTIQAAAQAPDRLRSRPDAAGPRTGSLSGLLSTASDKGLRSN